MQISENNSSKIYSMMTGKCFNNSKSEKKSHIHGHRQSEFEVDLIKFFVMFVENMSLFRL